MELFLWAVLTDRHRLIDFFWHRCKQPILMAIVAAAIYSKLGWFYRGISKHVKVLQERKVLFQDRANKVLVIELVTKDHYWPLATSADRTGLRSGPGQGILAAGEEEPAVGRQEPHAAELHRTPPELHRKCEKHIL